jgi:predicted lipid-binding transport protein (Tim44 family)
MDDHIWHAAVWLMYHILIGAFFLIAAIFIIATIITILAEVIN